MVLALQNLRRAFHERQRRLAIGVARIEELNRHYQDGAYCSLDDHSIQYTAAWEELFSRPEWHQADLTHKGRCSCCSTVVSRSSVTCSICAAVWSEPSDNAKLKSKLLFGVTSIVFGGLIASVIGEYFSHIFNTINNSSNVTVVLMPEFADFLISYLDFTVFSLALIFSTYIYEWFGLAPTGRWTRPNREDQESV